MLFRLVLFVGLLCMIWVDYLGGLGFWIFVCLSGFVLIVGVLVKGGIRLWCFVFAGLVFVVGFCLCLKFGVCLLGVFYYFAVFVGLNCV